MSQQTTLLQQEEKEEDLLSSTLLVDIVKALINEYSETVSAEFIQYIKDEEFDHDTLTADICDDDELINCSIAMHLIEHEQFQSIFDSEIKQEKLLLILKAAINGKSIDKDKIIKIIFCDDKSGEIDPSKYKMYTFSKDTTLKAIAQKIEDELDDIKDNNDNHPSIHIWIKFGQLKSIYTIYTFSITLDNLKYQNDNRWVEVPDDYLDKFKIRDIFSTQDDNSLVIERRQNNNIWPRSKQSNWKLGMAIGDIVDARNDKRNQWFEALIRYIYPDGHTNANFAIVHYIGLSTKYDEMIYIHDELHIAKRHTHSNGPYRKSSIFNKDIVGLLNLGNTSFICSIIQPLARTKQLTQYFLNEDYKDDINKSNPLGWKGQIAEQWGLLLKDIFSGKHTAIDWTHLKSVLSECAPQFSVGYQHQDANQFLVWLLDALHEDLNHIKKKPVIDNVEDDGRPNEIVAVESFQRYLKRNQSEVNDLFTWQNRKETECMNCGNHKVSFESSNVLSLDIPDSDQKLIQYTFIDCDAFVIPKRHGIKVTFDGNIGSLKDLVSKKHKVLKEELFVCEIEKNDIKRRLNDTEKIFESINDQHDIFMYNIPKPVSENGQYHTFTLINRRSLSTNISLIGFPLLLTLSLDEQITQRQLRYKLWHIIKAYIYDELVLNEDKLPFKLIAAWSGSNQHEIIISDSDDIFTFKDQSTLKFIVHWIDTQQYNIHPYDMFQTPKADNLKQFEEEKKSTETSETIDITECLKIYGQETIKQGDDALYCSECKDFVPTTQKSDIWTSSDILIINFNRWLKKQAFEEIPAMIKFPLQGLDLSDYVLYHDNEQDSVYDLYGITIRCGGMSRAHWISYFKSIYDKEWYHADDSRVEKVNDLQQVLQDLDYGKVHALFYRRQIPKNQKYNANSVKLSDFKICRQ